MKFTKITWLLYCSAFVPFIALEILKRAIPATIDGTLLTVIFVFVVFSLSTIIVFIGDRGEA